MISTGLSAKLMRIRIATRIQRLFLRRNQLRRRCRPLYHPLHRHLLLVPTHAPHIQQLIPTVLPLHRPLHVRFKFVGRTQFLFLVVELVAEINICH